MHDAVLMPRLAVIACVVVALGRSAGGQAAQEFHVDAAASIVVMRVGRAGVFAFAGHDHEVIAPAVQGTVVLDRANVSGSRVALQFDAAAMKVTGRGEPAADVPEVQRVMLSDRVLDVQRYPTIAFMSRRISLVEESSGRLSVRIEGELTLRGRTRPLTMPVEVRVSADRLTASGTATVRQTDYGIRPVTAGAGTVRVKDEVEVGFTIVARVP
jgi:polyisoprenoid-binding protein YceI